MYKTETEKLKAMLEVADWLIENSAPPKNHDEWAAKIKQYCELKSTPVEPAKSAEEIVTSAETILNCVMSELGESHNHVVMPVGKGENERFYRKNVVIHAMHQFAAQQVTAATADIKRERDEYYDTLQQHRVTIAEMQKRIEELEAMVPKWVSVEDGLPDASKLKNYAGHVIVAAGSYAVFMVALFKGGKFIDPLDGADISKYVYEWMYIPKQAERRQSPTSPTTPTGHVPDNSESNEPNQK